MEQLRRISGVAAPLLRDNVDTDAIIPSRETQSVARTGYGEKLFANWRYEPGTRIETPGFVLNRAPYRDAVILVSGRNFGCGSSREAATWALRQYGIRCIIAESYGAIFRNNCMRNGILPIALEAGQCKALIADSEPGPGAGAVITVDLEACRIESPKGRSIDFSIDALDRQMLLEGLDEIELTLRHSHEIAAFRRRDAGGRPWIHLRRGSRPGPGC